MLLGSTVAQAAPRVGLLVGGDEPLGAAAARAELEAVGLEVRMISPSEIPLAGRFAELEETRRTLDETLATARERFVAMRFDEALAIAKEAERTTSRWRGDRTVGRRLAELSVVAALCGDRDGFARAVARSPHLKLDAARWSPDARAGLDRARLERARAPRVRLTIAGTLTGAAVFVDGARTTSLEIDVPAGVHAVLALLPGRVPFDATIDLHTATTLEPRAPEVDVAEQLPLLRLWVETGAAPDEGALRLASEQLGLDAVLAPDLHADAWREGLRTEARAISSACSIRHTPPERVRAQRPLALMIEAGRCLSAVRGQLRSRGVTIEVGVTLPRVDDTQTVSLAVPAALLPVSDRPYLLEYGLWGLTRSGARTLGLGSEHAPMRVLVESTAIPRWYRKWWVWTLVGAAVTASIVVPAVVLTRPDPTTDVRLVGGASQVAR